MCCPSVARRLRHVRSAWTIQTLGSQYAPRSVVVDLDGRQTLGKCVPPVAREPHPGPLLPVGDGADDRHRPGDRLGDRPAAADMHPYPRIERLAVLSSPRHILLDRGDRVTVFETRADRGDQVLQAGVPGGVGHRVEHPVGKAAALERRRTSAASAHRAVGRRPAAWASKAAASIASIPSRNPSVVRPSRTGSCGPRR